MKLLGKNGLCRWIEYALLGLIGVAGVMSATLPFSIPLVTKHQPSYTLINPGADNYFFEKYLVVLLVSGVLSIFILWNARCIMRIINSGNPFVADIVRRLRLIAVQCLFLSVFYFISVFFLTKFFMALIFVTFCVVGLILLVFAELFRQAIEYKEENDMTI